MAVRRILTRYSIGEMSKMAVGWGARRLTSSKRKLPNFMIIGGQRCGTTSLYNYVAQHPDVVPAFIKETHFFDRAYGRGLDWYRTFFPLSNSSHPGRKKITGEATPYYLFDHYVPARVAEAVPDVKLIVLLRNPIDRAYSHYQFESRIGKERLSFAQAVEREFELFSEEEARVLADPEYQSDVFSRFSYVARGLYLKQLQRWRKYFSEEQFLIIKSEDFYKNTAAVLSSVFWFLGLDDVLIPDRKSYNSAVYEPMPDQVRSLLADHFTPFNQQLYNYLGRDFKWNNTGSKK